MATAIVRDEGHVGRVLTAVDRALTTVPFYAKQGLVLERRESIDATLAELPLLTRDRVRLTLPKVWFPEGRDAKAELAAGVVSIVESGTAESRVRLLFDPRWWREQERSALRIHPRAQSAIDGELGPHRDAVLWVPERGTGSCGAGDPSYEDRVEGHRLYLNSRQDPTFWTEPVMTRMLDELARHETTALLADPFYLDVLARHARVLGRRIDVRGFIATTRARATLAHRAAFEAVYSPAGLVDVYGARAVGTLFVEESDGKMHHVPTATHVEFLRAKVETPGAENVALVVVTTLEREIQPLVRYVLGDLVQVDAGESRYTTVKPIVSVEGSIDDAIVRPDGALVTPGAIDRAIGPEPRGYQVVQTESGNVDVEVVGGSPARVEEALAPLLSGMRVTARTSTAIGVEPNGKYRTTLRKRPLALSAVFEDCEKQR
jgi:hypothetical protein